MTPPHEPYRDPHRHTHRPAETINRPEGMVSVSDVRARKRAELGLAPIRPTAKSTLYRPPEPARASWALLLLPAGLILIIFVTIFLMLGAGNRLAGFEIQSDWSWARLRPPVVNAPDSPLASHDEGGAQNQPSTVESSAVGEGVGDEGDWGQENDWSTLATGQPRLRLSDNFAGEESIFAATAMPGQWQAEHIADQAIYRMEVSPTYVAWSLLDRTQMAQNDDAPVGYRIQAAATVASHTPLGYAGLVARVHEDRQLILLAVDGQGRFSIQQVREGVAAMVVPWTPADALNPAGTGNVVTIEDDGETMRFYGNQFPLFQMRVNDWAPGQLGIAAGARRDGVGEIRFEWFQLYDFWPAAGLSATELSSAE